MASFLFKTKRIYDTTSEDDGYRILIDRLWPRGVSKQKAQFNQWMKEVAPSNELRNWFNHDPEKWVEFQRKYAEELRAKSDLLAELKQLEREQGTVTLLFSAKETEHNNATALKVMLEKQTS